MKKSFYALLFSLVLAIVTLVGCGGSSAAAGSSGKVTLESAPEQTDSHSGTDQESSGSDGQSSELQSAPDQVAEDTKDEAAVNEPETAGDEPEAAVNEPETAGDEPEAAVNEPETAGDEPEAAVNEPETAGDEPEAAVNEPETAGDESKAAVSEPEATIDENGTYTSKEDVALYLHIYGRLPKNFITKKEAKKLGWEGGSLERYAKGKCIGGDHFGNYEGILPQGNYHECDIDTLGRKSRGAKRIIYSDDGRIYYTEDHYETFELLYGEE